MKATYCSFRMSAVFLGALVSLVGLAEFPTKSVLLLVPGDVPWKELGA